MKALIIAAGRGSRLQNLIKTKPKPLIQLLGLSLIERVILTAKQSGINEFVIIIGYLGDKIKATLGDGKRLGVIINYIENNEWKRGNGTSVLKAKELLNEKFVLLMSDHIFDFRILKELIDYDINKSCVLAVDRKKPQRDDTKVLEENGRIIDIGKNIEKSNCIDTGIFLCLPKIFSYIEEVIQEGKTELADGIAEAAKNGDAETFDITLIENYDSKMKKEIKPWWLDIDSEEDLKAAEEYLIKKI
ncbi:MAG: nucleotidyltransferase [Candidatus Cloacimonadota bacterium]|nr:MAG: nucleotidyltransferase [Candidatus Cloacimonadota bacterium]